MTPRQSSGNVGLGRVAALYIMYVADIYIVPRNHGLVVSAFFFTTLAVMAVILRIITRVGLVHNIGIDDGLITLAAVSP